MSCVESPPQDCNLSLRSPYLPSKVLSACKCLRGINLSISGHLYETWNYCTHILYILFKQHCDLIWVLTSLLCLQCERDAMARREKEILLKAEAVEAAQRANSMAEARAADLEIKLQQCMADHDSLELRLEEANQASGMNQSHVLISTSRDACC